MLRSTDHSKCCELITDIGQEAKDRERNEWTFFSGAVSPGQMTAKRLLFPRYSPKAKTAMLWAHYEERGSFLGEE